MGVGPTNRLRGKWQALRLGIAWITSIWVFDASTLATLGAASVADLPPPLASEGFGGLTEPTAPIAGSRALADWEPAGAVMINVSPQEVLETPDLLACYRQIVEALTRYVPVVVGYDGEDSRFALRLEDALRPANSDAKDRFPVETADSKTNEYWIRDYGPIFCMSASNRLVLVDTIYRDWREEIDAFEQTGDLTGPGIGVELEKRLQFRTKRLKSDTSPLAVMKILRQSFRLSSETTRPPLVLPGSEMQTDGEGLFFVAEEAAFLNGGRVALFEGLTRDYFGAEEIHLLDTLREWGSLRLDSQVKLAGGGYVFVTRPQFSAPLSQAAASFERERAEAVFRSNWQYLEKFEPRLRRVELPTLPIAEVSNQPLLYHVRVRLLKAICQNAQIDFDLYRSLPAVDEKRLAYDQRIYAYLKEKVGYLGQFSDDDYLAETVPAVLGRSLWRLVAEERQNRSPFRSYTSSFVLGLQGRPTVVLLPRYAAQKDDAAGLILQTEREVERAYRLAYPDAMIHWVDADPLTVRGGTLHRALLALPRGRERS
ncbi:agmatine deiminase family protein [Pelagicoccus sp. SDUM812003]|uniref:agmatine deiminase family protein n=1 Tax=Pelagicoccus sp. SDUM812003 TaxID=3041267 RepID=UPI00280CB52F|nr:agmatine deiminase family protein [Pelagicoccus sp. SDUM812003]MDQ8204700.1 agmatine deiminase family protein [Pelagicoccus sp. SDUM812003]